MVTVVTGTHVVKQIHLHICVMTDAVGNMRCTKIANSSTSSNNVTMQILTRTGRFPKWESDVFPSRCPLCNVTLQ